ncbi:MAG: bifunctional (p)ppGpp synthetase/guanosine-3',5'-bis(diphosphate) 3'-pyrophosphohydrolase, partial [Clostridia bacterium]|nr:bifunctional (p)ppGpp synthetase/guanosine-3',5'-bis(diphosphate) 3'-pyrophosphohydrolase [Clostridia bacterium]
YDEEIIKKEIQRHTFQTIDDLYAAIGYGAVPARSIVNKLREAYRKSLEEMPSSESGGVSKYHTSSNGIIVEGIENCLVRLSRCCSPVPGDKIIGYITRGRGVSVHRADCVNVKNNFIGQGESDRLIEVKWESSQPSASYMAELTVLADDRNGLLLDLMSVLSNLKIATHNFNARTGKDFDATITIMVEIHSSQQLEEVIRKMMGVAGVVSVSRTMQ